MQGTREAPRGWAIVDLVVRYYPRVSFARYATPVLCPWIEKAPLAPAPPDKLLSFLGGSFAPHTDNQSFMLGALAQIDQFIDEGAFDR